MQLICKYGKCDLWQDLSVHRTRDIYWKVHFYDCKMLLWFSYNLLISYHATGSETADGMRDKPKTRGCRNVLSPNLSLIQTRASGGHSWPLSVFWNLSLPLASRSLCFPGFLLILQWPCPLLLWFFLPRHLRIFELLRTHCSPTPSLCACLWGGSPMPGFSASAVSLGPHLYRSKLQILESNCLFQLPPGRLTSISNFMRPLLPFITFLSQTLIASHHQK